MVRTVGHEMEEHLAAPHRRLGTVDEREGHVLVKRRLALRRSPIDEPIIYLLLRRPERRQFRMQQNVARLKPVLAAFEMRLPDQVDDIAVVERTNNGLEERLALFLRLARRQGGHAIEDHLVRPSLVLGEHLDGARADHLGSLPIRSWAISPTAPQAPTNSSIRKTEQGRPLGHWPRPPAVLLPW